jgi:hypothetical protein
MRCLAKKVRLEPAWFGIVPHAPVLTLQDQTVGCTTMCVATLARKRSHRHMSGCSSDCSTWVLGCSFLRQKGQPRKDPTATPHNQKPPGSARPVPLRQHHHSIARDPMPAGSWGGRDPKPVTYCPSALHAAEPLWRTQRSKRTPVTSMILMTRHPLRHSGGTPS